MFLCGSMKCSADATFSVQLDGLQPAFPIALSLPSPQLWYLWLSRGWQSSCRTTAAMGRVSFWYPVILLAWTGDLLGGN